jgi:hypothetical protein
MEEIVVYCRELLSSADTLVVTSMSLDEAVKAEFSRGRFFQSLDEANECLRDVVRMCPLGHPVLFALTNTLDTRFMKTHSNEDYEEAMAPMAVLVNLPHTSILKHSLLPFLLWQVWRCAVGLNFSVGLALRSIQFTLAR